MYESVHEFLKMILHEWVLDICFYRTSGFKDWGYTNLNGQTYRSISRYIYIAFVTVCNATFYLSYLISSVSCILQYGKIAMTFLLSSTGWNVERHEQIEGERLRTFFSSFRNLSWYGYYKLPKLNRHILTTISIFSFAYYNY